MPDGKDALSFLMEIWFDTQDVIRGHYNIKIRSALQSLADGVLLNETKYRRFGWPLSDQ